MAKELITLVEAARELDCSVAAVRARVRKGTLPSMLGPRGAYLVSKADLRRQPRVRPGRPRHPRPRLSHDELAATWDLLDGLLDTREGRPHLAHAKALRHDPDSDPFLYHLVSVHRLRAAGLSYEQLADEIGISARQARRLGRRDLRWSIHLDRARHAKKADLEAAKQVSLELRARLEAEGVRSAVRPSPYRKGEFLLLSKVVRPEATTVIVARLRDAGLTRKEIDAVMRIGVSSDELNELMLRGLDAQRSSS